MLQLPCYRNKCIQEKKFSMKIRLFSDLILLVAVSVSLCGYVHVHAGSQKFKHLDLL